MPLVYHRGEAIFQVPVEIPTWRCPRHSWIWCLREWSGLEIRIWTNQEVTESHGCGDHQKGREVWEGRLEQSPGEQSHLRHRLRPLLFLEKEKEAVSQKLEEETFQPEGRD